MKKKKIRAYCISCGKPELSKDEVGINMKLLGENVDNFYCLNCLADYLEVTAQEIHFTAEFKQAFWDLYRSGTSPVLVMRQLGYDTDLLGKERIRGIRTAVQRQALSPEGFRTGYKPYRKRRRPESIDALPPDQTLKRMQSEITYLRQEMEFLKKLINSDGESRRRR